MPKRFVDTDIWEKEWFMSCTPTEKCLVKYVRDKCDLAGIWKPNFTLATYVIGSKVDEEILLNIDNGNQFERLQDGKIRNRVKPIKSYSQKSYRFAFQVRCRLSNKRSTGQRI